MGKRETKGEGPTVSIAEVYTPFATQVKLVGEKKKKLEAILDSVAPYWKHGPLYIWQYDSAERRDRSPREIYGLELNKWHTQRASNSVLYYLLPSRLEPPTAPPTFVLDVRGSTGCYVLTNILPRDRLNKISLVGGSAERTVSDLSKLLEE